MRFIGTLFTIILYVPIFLVILYSIFYPRDSALFGKRWQFQNENLEPSEDAIKFQRKAGIALLIVTLIILAIIIFNIWSS